VRLWTVHPKYLDTKGLLALWREALLAQKVLQGQTHGYRAHPQLQRFKATQDPIAAITAYLWGVYRESVRRGYAFDAAKIARQEAHAEIEETTGQLRYEWEHLKKKLAQRAPDLYAAWLEVALPEAHPLFRIVEGEIGDWEKQR